MSNPTTTTRRRFTIELEHVGDGDEFQGLRRWLKAAWRSYNLRCIDIATHPPLLPVLDCSESPDASGQADATDAADRQETGKAGIQGLGSS